MIASILVGGTSILFTVMPQLSMDLGPSMFGLIYGVMGLVHAGGIGLLVAAVFLDRAQTSPQTTRTLSSGA